MCFQKKKGPSFWALRRSQTDGSLLTNPSSFCQMSTTTRLQECLLEELPELNDYDKVCFHLFNEQDVGEDHEEFWRKALRVYCLQRGVLSACFADLYRDFTIPFVVPGELQGPFGFGSPQSDNASVKVYPESLKLSLSKLRQAKDILAGTDVRVASATASTSTSKEGGVGWFHSVLKSLSPIKDSSNDITTFASDMHFVPVSLLKEMATIVLKCAQKVEGGSSSGSVYYLDNGEASKLYERSLKESDKDLQTGPLTIHSLLQSTAKFLEGRSGGDAGAGGQVEAAYRKLMQRPSEANDGGVVLSEALVNYMLSSKMAVLSSDGQAIKIAFGGDEESLIFDARDTALLSTRSTLLSLRYVAKDIEAKIATKTDKARAFLRKASEAKKTGNTSMEPSFNRQAKTQLVLRGQLQKQYDSAAGALLKLESALLTLEGQQVHQQVLDSIHNATSTLKRLRESEAMSVERAEEVIEACDEELGEHAALSADIQALMMESVEDEAEGRAAELELELEVLMGGATLSPAKVATATGGASDPDPDANAAAAAAGALPVAPSHRPLPSEAPPAPAPA